MIATAQHHEIAKNAAGLLVILRQGLDPATPAAVREALHCEMLDALADLEPQLGAADYLDEWRDADGRFISATVAA